MQFLKSTKSLCPVCLKIIDANVITNNGKVFITKECKKHGKFKFFHIHDDLEVYEKMQELLKKVSNFHPSLGTIDLTYKCNLDCPFCCNFGGERENYEPKIMEIKKQLKRLNKFMSRKRIELFGGEPTLRKDLLNIVKILKKNGYEILLATNGLKLDGVYTKKLKLAGLDVVLLQFDGLDKKTYKILRGKDILDKKLNAISNLRKNKIFVAFFVTLVKGVNDSQIGELISFAINSDIVTIDFVPLCPEGRMPPFKVKHLSNSEILNKIEGQTGITKYDFLEYTEFIQILVKFLEIPFFRVFYTFFERGFGKVVQKAPGCLLRCRVFMSESKFIPICRVIKLKKLTRILENTINISKGEERLTRFKAIFYFSKELFKLMIRNTDYLRLFLIGKFRKALRIGVWSFNDRYNIDFDLIRYCNNITQMPDGNFGAFCLKNILQTQLMKKEGYKFNGGEI